MQQEIDAQRFFEQVTAAACEELFRRYGVPVQRSGDGEEPVSPDFLLCSVIGFTGRDLRGTLVLAVTDELSGLSNPVGSASANPVTQRDWVGELSNQLLGRIKLELLRRGVEMYLNLPAVLRGQHLAPLPRMELRPIKFTLAKGAAAVWIEVETRPGFKIEADAQGDQGPAAGEPILFE